jgi:hypothetical protein
MKTVRPRRVSPRTRISPDAPPRLSRQHISDRKWVSDHLQELIKNYPNRWIMVYKGEVLVDNENLGPVVDKADELGLNQPVFHFVERDVYVY